MVFGTALGPWDPGASSFGTALGPLRGPQRGVWDRPGTTAGATAWCLGPPWGPGTLGPPRLGPPWDHRRGHNGVFGTALGPLRWPQRGVWDHPGSLGPWGILVWDRPGTTARATAGALGPPAVAPAVVPGRSQGGPKKGGHRVPGRSQGSRRGPRCGPRAVPNTPLWPPQWFQTPPKCSQGGPKQHAVAPEVVPGRSQTPRCGPRSGPKHPRNCPRTVPNTPL